VTTKLEFWAVSFGYGPRTIVEELTFGVERGEMLALLGANGVGKTTILNLACGTLRPRFGEVRYDERDLTTIPPRERARRIALVPQALSIPFAFSVREVVALGRTPFRRRFGRTGVDDTRAIERALEQTETETYADRCVLDLSAGERQRVILAMALAQEPELLLLDEPTANLDVAHQIAFLRLARDLSRDRGLTVVAAIHDLNLAALSFDHLIAIHQGRTVANGTPRDVLTPHTIRTIYGTPVEVIDHPTSSVPLVALVWPSD
jgi:iron complex transport system ATP-binding protein